MDRITQWLQSEFLAQVVSFVENRGTVCFFEEEVVDLRILSFWYPHLGMCG